VNVPWPSPPSSSGSLVGVGLTDGIDLQRVHTDLGVEDLELAVAWINHHLDSVHCNREQTEQSRLPILLLSIHTHVHV
jgi:hypothetical protein